MFSDVAIKNKERDLLNRSVFAAEIARGLEHSLKNNVDSIVLGLNGSWGSGKSTLVNFIVEDTKKRFIDSDSTLIDIHFNPWMFSNQSELLSLFFKQLQQQLSTKKERFKKITKKLKTYVDLVEPAKKVIPVPFAEIAVTSISKFLHIFSADKDLITLKKEIDKLVVESGIKLLITIDDIDRLNPIEIKEIFKLVKLNANFKNTVFILAYDREVVIESLQNEFNINAARYLEKIVQVDYTVPNPSNESIHGVLISRLEESFLLGASDNNKGLKSSFEQVLKSLTTEPFVKYLKNIRDVNRFVNSLILRLPSIYHQVNIIDFLHIEALRIFDPELYSFILTNKDELVFRQKEVTYVMSAFRNDKTKAEKKPIQFIENSELNDANKDTLKHLFIFDVNSLGRQIIMSERDLIREKRLGSRDYFNRYFSLQLTSKEIKEEHFTGMLSDNSVETKITILKQVGENDNLRLFANLTLDKCYRPTELIIEQIIKAYLTFSVDLRILPRVKSYYPGEVYSRINELSAFIDKHPDTLKCREIIIDFFISENKFKKPPIFKFKLAEEIMASYHRFHGNYHTVGESFKSLLYLEYKLDCEVFVDRISACIMLYCKSHFFANVNNLKSLNRDEITEVFYYLSMFNKDYLTEAVEPFFTDIDFFFMYLNNILTQMSSTASNTKSKELAFAVKLESIPTNHTFEYLNSIVDSIDMNILTTEQLKTYTFYQEHRKFGFDGKHYITPDTLEVAHIREGR